MLVGMTMVTIFLLLLIFMMYVIHWVDIRFFPETSTGAPGRPGAGADDEIAALTAAVHKYIRDRGEK